MKETVGFRSFPVLLHPELIKRDALMFSRIGIMGLGGLVGDRQRLEELFLELPWLIEQGLVFDPHLEISTVEPSEDKDVRRSVSELREIILKHKEEFLKFFGDRENISSYFDKLPPGIYREGGKEEAGSFEVFLDSLLNAELFLRLFSAYYRSIKHIDTYPIISGKLPELSQGTGSIGDVIEIVINQLPTPGDATPWEQIIDYRNDPDTEIKFRRLRSWMNKIARANLTPLEVEQELEHLLDEYQEHMKLHRMKTNASKWETVLVAITDRKHGDIVKAVYSVRHKQLALLEAESKAPGREIA